MSHQIGSRTPRRDTYVGFCLYHEDQEEGVQLYSNVHNLIPKPLVNTMEPH